jgi:hypothetical protein
MKDNLLAMVLALVKAMGWAPVLDQNMVHEWVEEWVSRMGQG